MGIVLVSLSTIVALFWQEIIQLFHKKQRNTD